MPSYPTVLSFPNAKLRRVAEKLPDSVFGTSGLNSYCQILANLLTATERADVLAGTQISFDPPWRVLAMTTGNSTAAGVAILCNPEIRDESGERIEFERSASFACTPALLSAPTKLTVEYRKPTGERRKIECGRTGARAVFQGVESLRGKPFIDRMTAEAAHQFMRRYREEIEELLAPQLFLPDTELVLAN